MTGLRPGGLFAVRTKGFLGWAIRAVQWFWSTDNEAKYNHVGVILNRKGVTLEALWKFQKYSLEHYLGQEVLIVWHRQMTKARFILGYDAVRADIGCIYPVWRFIPFLLHLAKFFRFFGRVCSEQTGKFMYGAGFKNIIYGITPDNLVDRWRVDKDMEIIFEGILTEEILKKLKEGVL